MQARRVSAFRRPQARSPRGTCSSSICFPLQPIVQTQDGRFRLIVTCDQYHAYRCPTMVSRALQTAIIARGRESIIASGCIRSSCVAIGVAILLLHTPCLHCPAAGAMLSSIARWQPRACSSALRSYAMAPVVVTICAPRCCTHAAAFGPPHHHHVTRQSVLAQVSWQSTRGADMIKVGLS